MNTNQRVEYIKQNGYSLSFGDTLNQAFDIFKGVFLFGLVFSIISFVLSSLLQTVISSLFGMDNLQLEITEIFKNSGFSANSWNKVANLYISNTNTIFYYIVVLVVDCLIFPLNAGVIYISHQYATKKSVDFGDIFYGYNGKVFFKLISLYFIQTIIVSIASLFFILPGIWLSVAFTIAVPFILFNDDSAIDALKNSFSVINKNWWTVFGLLLVGGLIAISGFLACCVGIVFTIAFIYVLIYSIYKNSVGVDDETSEIESIGTE